MTKSAKFDFSQGTINKGSGSNSLTSQRLWRRGSGIVALLGCEDGLSDGRCGSTPKGIKVSDADIASLNIQPANFHGEWNYTFVPRTLDV